jgi:hypothetical protein
MTPMEIALDEARSAAARGEVPAGAVVRCWRAGNEVEALHNPTAHAEMLALRAASADRSETRLPDCQLVVTLELLPGAAAAVRSVRSKGWRPGARGAGVRRAVLLASAGGRGGRAGGGGEGTAAEVLPATSIGSQCPTFTHR